MDESCLCLQFVYLTELQNPPVNNKDTSEDINKVVKLPWIPIIGPKLRQAFKK